MLIEHLALARIWRHVDEHLAVLLEHVPVPFLERRAVEKAPDLAREVLRLAQTPEEHEAVFLIHGGGEADDAERTPGAGRGGVGDVEAAIGRGGLRHHLGPIEIFFLLLDAADDETRGRALDAHLILFGAERQRERVGVQVGAVHRVGEIVEGKPVIAGPRRDAQDRAPFRTGEFFRQGERRRLGVFGAREVDEDRVVGFLDRKTFHWPAALERAARHGRDSDHRAAAVERHAVIAAGNVVAQNLAAREFCATMRAIILEAVQLPAGVAPKHEVAPECFDCVRYARLDLHGLGHRIPLVEQPAVNQRVNALLIVGHHVQFPARLLPHKRPRGPRGI